MRGTRQIGPQEESTHQGIKPVSLAAGDGGRCIDEWTDDDDFAQEEEVCLFTYNMARASSINTSFSTYGSARKKSGYTSMSSAPTATSAGRVTRVGDTTEDPQPGQRASSRFAFMRGHRVAHGEDGVALSRGAGHEDLRHHSDGDPLNLSRALVFRAGKSAQRFSEEDDHAVKSPSCSKHADINGDVVWPG